MEEPDMMDDNEPKSKGRWTRRFVGLLVLVVIIAGAYYSRSYWHPKVQVYLHKYIPWYKSKAIAKPLTPIQQLQSQVNQLMATNQQLQTQQQAMQAALERTGKVNDSWVIAGASYLTRSANYQLQINHDPETAIKLLQTADKRIASLSNPQYQGVRQLLAGNIMQLQSLAKIDTAGLIARLIATSEQVRSLHLLRPKLAESKTKVLVQSYQPVWKKALDTTWHSLRDLIVVRKLKAPIAPLLTKDQRVNLNQHITALLQQAQWAVLHHNKQVYQLSLAQTQDMVNRYFVINQAATKAILANLAQLAAINVSPRYPDLGATVVAVDQLSQLKKPVVATHKLARVTHPIVKPITAKRKA